MGYIDAPTFNDGSSQLRFFIRQTGNTYKGLVLNTRNDILGFWNHETLTTYLVPYLITYSYGNDGTWYRKWSDGFIEQGGIIESFADVWTITFPVPFTTTSYMLQGEQWGTDATGNLGINTQTTTSASGNHVGGGTIKVSWYACGY